MLSLAVTVWAVSLVALAALLGLVIAGQAAAGWVRQARTAWSYRGVQSRQPSTVGG